MPVDATGPATSPDLIPTYNTAVDAPSGKGLNNIIASLQASLVANYLRKPAGILVGDPMIWTGTGWDKPGGTKTGSNFLRDDGQWASPSPGIPTGVYFPYGGIVAPTGFVLCDGAAYSRAVQSALFGCLVASKGTATVTIASPGVWTLNGHGLVAGDTIYLETTGALPTGLSVAVPYYLITTGLTVNTFQLSATRGGTAIATTGSQSGTHTVFQAPFANSTMGATTFTVPDMHGRTPVGATMGGIGGGKIDVNAMGANEALAANLRNVSHHHVQSVYGGNNQIQGGATIGISSNTSGDADNTDKPAYLTSNWIIKT
jgi:hypothetical protein